MHPCAVPHHLELGGVQPRDVDGDRAEDGQREGFGEFGEVEARNVVGQDVEADRGAVVEELLPDRDLEPGVLPPWKTADCWDGSAWDPTSPMRRAW